MSGFSFADGATPLVIEEIEAGGKWRTSRLPTIELAPGVAVEILHDGSD